jgi:hypothetical protein
MILNRVCLVTHARVHFRTSTSEAARPIWALLGLIRHRNKLHDSILSNATSEDLQHIAK